jgi:hypothetical protein
MERIFTEPEAVFEQACGVIAHRLEVDTETAGHILERVARREGVTTSELAADVVASCTRATFLPRDLYTNGHGYESAA